MFISSARSNSVFSLVLILLVAVGLWMPAFLYPTPPTVIVPMPLFAPIDAYCRLHPAFAVSMGFTFALLQAFLLNFIVHSQQVLAKRSWLPALLFVTLTASTPGLLWFHPQMLAGTLLLLTFYILLGTYRTDRAYGAVFNCGILVGLAALLYFPSVSFVLFGLVVMIVLRPFIWREWMIYICGFILPWIYSGVYFFVKDKMRSEGVRVIIEPLVNRDFFFKYPVEYYAPGIMCALLLVVAAGRFVAGSGTSTLKTKKGVTTMIWFLVFATLAVLPAQNNSVSTFLFAIYPVSIFISNYFLVARRVWLAEIIYIMLLLSIAGAYFFADIRAIVG